MAERRSQKYREKVKCPICKIFFNFDYKDKHSETMHKGEKVKVKYSFVTTYIDIKAIVNRGTYF